MARDWSALEIEAVVADYFDMLASELRGESYNKAAHRRALLQGLNARSDASVEFKRRNVSAILREEGVPWIAGYKPAVNYQGQLKDAVAARLLAPGLLRLLESSVSRSAPEPGLVTLDVVEDPPPLADLDYVAREPTTRILKVDFLEREASNRSLGLAGEQWVVEFERARLVRAGLERLARSVDHVALSVGDGLGFDIRSFDSDGRERFIEVKTTAYGKQTPFYISRGELAFARSTAECYQLYRLFHFRASPRLYTVGAPLERRFRMDPTQFAATPGSDRPSKRGRGV